MDLGGNSTLLNHGALALGQMQGDLATSFDTSRSFQGMIDEVRVWNVALNQSVLAARMSYSLLGNDTNSPNLVAYWNMEVIPAAGIIADVNGGLNLSLCGWNMSAVVCSTPALSKLH